MKKNSKNNQFSRILLRSEFTIQVKIWKLLNLPNSVRFIKKPLVNQVCIWIWSFWLTFTVLQWMKKNSKNSQFSRFLLRSGYAILVKIWKWLKLLNSVAFIKKRLLNHFYIRTWASWLTFTVSQGIKANIKISQFSRFLLRSEYPIQVKIWKWLKLLMQVSIWPVTIPPGHPGGFAPKCVPSPRAFAQQKMPGSRANEGWCPWGRAFVPTGFQTWKLTINTVFWA